MNRTSIPVFQNPNCFFFAVCWVSVLMLSCGMVGCRKTPDPSHGQANFHQAGGDGFSEPAPVVLSPTDSKRAGRPSFQTLPDAIKALLADKSDKQKMLLPALVFFNASPTQAQQARQLLAKQFLWEKGRRACNALAALYKLANTPKFAVMSELRKQHPDRKEFVVQMLDCPAGMQFAHVELPSIGLVQARLAAANLRDANFQNADLQEAFLQKAQLQKSQLQKARLQKAQLQRAVLTSARLQNANLQNAQLDQAILVAAKLSKADLQYAQFVGANLVMADLRGAKLQRANFSGARLHATKFAGVQLQGTLFSSSVLAEGAPFGKHPSAGKSRKSRSLPRHSVCLEERIALECYSWHKVPPKQRTSSTPPANCPKRILGPILSYDADAQKKLTPSQQVKLQKGICP